MDFCFVGNQCLLNQSGLPTLHSRVSFWDTKRRRVGSDVWLVLALQITEVGGFQDIPPEQKTDPTGMLPALSCVQESLIKTRVFRHMKATRTCESFSHSLLGSPSHQGSAPASCPLQTATRLNPVKFWMLLTCILEKGLNREDCKQKGLWKWSSRKQRTQKSAHTSSELSRKCEKVQRLLLLMMGWPQMSGLFD